MEFLMPEESIRPQGVTSDVACQLLRTRYGIHEARLTQLQGYDDLNFRVHESKGIDNPHVHHISQTGYVLKIMNTLDSQNPVAVEAQHALMNYLDKHKFNVPVPVKTVEGKTYTVVQLNETSGCLLQLLIYLPGKTLIEDDNPSQELLYDVGKFAGKLTSHIRDFKHPGYQDRQSIWMLEAAVSLRKSVSVLEDEDKKKIVWDVLQEFEDNVITKLATFRKGLIHGDLNENNILVENNKVSGLLDFGDSHYSLLIFELAIVICYMLIHSNQLDCPKKILEGYFTEYNLEEKEKEVLKVCVCTRLCQTLVLGLQSAQKEPGNAAYLLLSQKNGWNILFTISKWGKRDLKEYWHLIFV